MSATIITGNGPLDPENLLTAVSELLNPKGAVAGPFEAWRVASLMKDANKLVSRCVFINILGLDTEKKTMEKLLESGGWEILNNWLQDGKEDENVPLMTDILKVYQVLPITVDMLKTNNAAKTIKQLCKYDHEDVKSIANSIIEDWMKKVKGINNSNDTKVKKGKEKERDKDSSKKSFSSNDSKIEFKSKNNSSKNTQREPSRRDDVQKSDSKKKSTERLEKQTEDMDTSSNDSAQNDDKLTVRNGAGLKLHNKLGVEKEWTAGKNNDGAVKKRASSVKIPPSKFRSTGIEEEMSTNSTIKLPKNADLSKPIPKRAGSIEDKIEVLNKKPRVHLPSPLSGVPSAAAVTSPTTPVEVPGRNKLTPPKPRHNRAIHESTRFMDSLDTSSRTYGAYKKKRTLPAASIPSLTNNNKEQMAPPTPSSLDLTTAAIAKGLPGMPSFCKEFQQGSELLPQDTDAKKERSLSQTDKMDILDINVKSEPNNEDSTLDSNAEVKTECSQSPTESKCSTKGLLTTGATKIKKRMKNVSWREDSILKEVFYFELDEDERVNVIRPKDFNQAKKEEMLFDRKAVESVRRMHHDHMSEQITWYRPKLMKDCKQIEFGKGSKEKTIQSLREQCVLQALFFDKTLLPDSAQEAVMESEELTEPKLIPLDDVSGGDEFLYDYKSHPQAVNVGSLVPASPAPEQPLHPFQPLPQALYQGPPPQNFNLPAGMNVPPEFRHLLVELQSSPANPNDPMMVHIQQLFNNIRSVNGDQKSYDELQTILQVMHSSTGMSPDGIMQGPPPGMLTPQQAMQQPRGPPMGPRSIIGVAPPCFMPQRPMPPGSQNIFGPPGQIPPGNWGWSMDGPNMGPPGNCMRGPRPGARGGSRGGGGRKGHILCRHFFNGSCQFGANCHFLHPGINGPPINHFNMAENGDYQIASAMSVDS